MKRHLIVLGGSLLAVAAVATAGVASGFGSQTSVRSFGHVKQMGPNMAGKKATSLAQLRGVNFVSGCRFSHRNTDDVIVYPGQPGKSHDHTYLGNDSTNAFSTVGTMLGATTSCRRPGDTAGYWVPTLIAANGTPVVPRSASVYYRRHTLDALQTFPPGFKMIAGDSKATAAQSLKVTSWNCGPRRRPAVEHDPDLPRRRPERARAARRVPGLLGRDEPRLARPQEPHGVLDARAVPGRPPGRGAGAAGEHPLRERRRCRARARLGRPVLRARRLLQHLEPGRLQRLVNGCLNALRHCQQGVVTVRGRHAGRADALAHSPSPDDAADAVTWRSTGPREHGPSRRRGDDPSHRSRAARRAVRPARSSTSRPPSAPRAGRPRAPRCRAAATPSGSRRRTGPTRSSCSRNRRSRASRSSCRSATGGCSSRRSRSTAAPHT